VGKETLPREGAWTRFFKRIPMRTQYPKKIRPMKLCFSKLLEGGEFSEVKKT